MEMAGRAASAARDLAVDYERTDQMSEDDQHQAAGGPGGMPPAGGEERSTTRRNLVIGGAAVAVGGAVAAGVAIGSGGGDDARTTPATGAGPTATGGRGSLTIDVNGEQRQVDATPETPLLYVLRDQLGLRGPKFGCGLSQCGACAVLSDGRQIRSCVTPVRAVKSAKITTLDGLAASYHGPGADATNPAKLHPLQQAWIDEQVPQCGYCQNGMIIQAADLLSTTPSPSDEQIVKAMDGHLCRCGTYNGIVRAIKRASKEMA
ncbi:MAG: xanthine dehydrogenase subunit [Conexibacter sp.]|jgi:aerobic-type carbon monoxide dehydrogenase small subunit (CoxS/CutS family)|nr:xanthine dehydrogenase subunit [Conexibacter sp.]